MRTLYLCGAGNSEGVRLALRVNAVDDRWDRMVLLDDDAQKLGHTLLDVEVVGPFDRLAGADPVRDSVVNLVARSTAGRRAAGDKIASFGVPFAGLIAPGVDLLGAEVSSDVLVYPGAVIGPEAEVGAGCVVFMGAVVGHEARVGSGCVIAANAVLNARVQMGDGVYVGSNASVLPELEIGAGATIGAGSTVVAPVPAGATVLGVPAQVVIPGSVPAPHEERHRPPTSAADLEGLLATAWAEALELPDVEGDTRIFELGATSLAALQVAARLRTEAGVELAVTDLFRFPTIRELAQYAASRTGPHPRPTSSAPVSSAPPPVARNRVSAGGQPLLDAIVTVFREVLQSPEAGPDSHFFELGGDPTLAQQACHALEQRTGEPLCFMQVARYPTPIELARHLEVTSGQPPSCPAQGVMTRMIHRHEWQRG